MTECEHNRACRMAYGGEGCKPPCDLDLFCNLYERKVDRDALLALADEMENVRSGYTAKAWFTFNARRIREALGVCDGR